MDKNIGRKLDGRYEITELIGIGGMADVYKAVDIIDDRTVAVKILKTEFSDNEDFIRRFRNESKAIAVLSHPNIVKIYDVGFTEKIQFIVMEYIDGITLKEFIDQQGVLKWKDSIHFIIQILRALQHAHDRGIVHRDIKPQNIMLFPDGTIKVMDFGIARFAREEGKTISDKAIGSVHYISPEQARGDITDEKSDIYSVGVMLYEMLTGTKPFDADNPVSIALMHMQNTAKTPRELNDSIPEGLEEIVIRAMQKESTKRYQSASEMIKDIEEFKRNPSIVFEYKYLNEKTQYYNTNTVNKAAAAYEAVGNRYNLPAERTSSRVKTKSKINYDYDDDEDYSKEERASKSSYLIVTLTAIAAVVVIIVVIFIAFFARNIIDTKTPAKGEMPNIIGMEYLEAKTAYEGEFTLSVKSKEYSSDYKEGEIISQSIEEGKQYIVGTSEVKVVVSKGQRLVQIPNVYTLEADTAQQMLEGQDFKVVIKSVVNDAEKDTVIETQPARDEMAQYGSTVIMVVSRGPEEQDVIMPDVVGKPYETAKSMLSGFTNVKYEEVDSSEDKGTVIEQSIPAKDENGSPTIVSPKQEIIIKVSSGEVPEEESVITFAVPDYVKGPAKFNAYINGNIVGTKTVDNIAYVATVSIDIKGSEEQIVIIEAVNTQTNVSDTIGEYDVNFTDNIVTEIRFEELIFQALFQDSSYVTEPPYEIPDFNTETTFTEWQSPWVY